MKPVKAWAIVTNSGEYLRVGVTREGSVNCAPILYLSKREADNVPACTGDRIVRVEIRAIENKRKVVKRKAK